jgi:hypothetical protein
MALEAQGILSLWDCKQKFSVSLMGLVAGSADKLSPSPDNDLFSIGPGRRYLHALSRPYINRMRTRFAGCFARPYRIFGMTGLTQHGHGLYILNRKHQTFVVYTAMGPVACFTDDLVGLFCAEFATAAYNYICFCIC